MTSWIDVHGIYGFLGDQLYKGIVDAAFSARPGSYLAADFLSEDTYQILKTKLKREHFFDVFLENMIDTVTARAMYSRRLKLVCNAGALDPLGCAEKLAAHLKKLGAPLQVAAVVGDNITGRMDELGPLPDLKTGEPFPAKARKKLTAAAVYIGAEKATEALNGGADIVVAGRMTDAGLALAACAAAHSWSYEDWDKMAAGVVAGHLLSCGGQSVRPVSLEGADLEAVGQLVYPIARVSDQGEVRLLSPTGATREAALSQLFYGVPEKHFIDPDVIVDLSDLEVDSLSSTEVSVRGAKGLPRPEKLRALFLYPGDSVSLKGALLVPRADVRAVGLEGVKALIGSRLRAGGALIENKDIQLESLGSTETGEMVFLAAHFEQDLYAKIARGQMPSLLVAGFNGGYAGMPAFEPETKIWDSLLDRSHIEPYMKVVRV